MNVSLFINLDTSLRQIGQYGTRLGIPLGNFGDPFILFFHNLIGGTSIKLQTRYVGETLYYITGHPNKSTKKLNIYISVCFTKVPRSSFKKLQTQDLKSKIS
jgi:hypothetical protein